jgi:hypothetical protein
LSKLDKTDNPQKRVIQYFCGDTLKMKIWNDQPNGEYDFIQVDGVEFNGSVETLEKANNGIFYTSTIDDDSRKSVFDGVIDQDERDIINDTEYAGTNAELNPDDIAFLDTGLQANQLSATWNDAIAAGTVYDNLFDTSGTFDTEMIAETQFR